MSLIKNTIFEEDGREEVSADNCRIRLFDKLIMTEDDKKLIVDGEKYFYNRLKNIEKSSEPPFKDAMCREFLKNAYDMKFADDGDWYSIYYTEFSEPERMDIYCINKALMCGLAAIERSQAGFYTYFSTMYERELQALLKLPMELLIAVNINSSFSGRLNFMTHYDGCFIENYPLKDGSEIMLKVDKQARNNGYNPAFEKGEGIYKSTEGDYYLDLLDSDFSDSDDDNIDWEKYIPKMIKYINRCGKPISLDGDVKTYGMFEFWHDVCGFTDDEPYGLDYFYQLRQKGWDRRSGEVSHEEYLRRLEELKQTDAFREYQDVKNNMRVICHTPAICREAAFTQVFIPFIEKRADGEMTLGTGSPYRDDDGILFSHVLMLDEVVKKRQKSVVKLFLVVDNRTDNTNDVSRLDNTLYGLKVSYDKLEILPADTALYEFVQWLKDFENKNKKG